MADRPCLHLWKPKDPRKQSLLSIVTRKGVDNGGRPAGGQRMSVFAPRLSQVFNLPLAFICQCSLLCILGVAFAWALSLLTVLAEQVLMEL